MSYEDIVCGFKQAMREIKIKSHLNHKQHGVFNVLLEGLDPASSNRTVDDSVITAESDAHHIGPPEIILLCLGIKNGSLFGLSDSQDA